MNPTPQSSATPPPSTPVSSTTYQSMGSSKLTQLRLLVWKNFVLQVCIIFS